MMRTTSILCLAMAAFGCGKKAPAIASCPASTKALSYAADIAPLMATHCTRCHSASATDRRGAPDDINYDTYASTKAGGVRGAAELKQGSMPDDDPTSMSTDSRCVFINWVDAGSAP